MTRHLTDGVLCRSHSRALRASCAGAHHITLPIGRGDMLSQYNNEPRWPSRRDYGDRVDLMNTSERGSGNGSGRLDRDAPGMTNGADHSPPPPAGGAPPGDQTEQDQIWMRGYGIGLSMGMMVGAVVSRLRYWRRWEIR